MTERRDDEGTGPVFNRVDGTNPYSEDLTLPLADIHSDGGAAGGSAPYGAPGGSGYSNSQTPPVQYPQQQYPQQQYAQRQYPAGPPQNTPYPQGQQGVQPWAPMSYLPAEHPQTSTVFILALIGFVVPVTPFIAWYMGSKAKREIEQGAPFRYEGNLKIGHIIGMVLSLVSIGVVAIYAIILIFYAVIMMGVFASI